MNTPDLILTIASSHSSIDAFYFVPFKFDGGVEDRIHSVSKKEVEYFRRARERKVDRGVSFWEAFLGLCVEDGCPSERAICLALHHNENRYIEVPSSNLRNFFEVSDQSIGINSRVRLGNGSVMHIPMLDFKVPVSATAQRVVRQVLIELNCSGYLLKSGKSYHFISNQIVSEDSLMDLLARFILLAPISDKAWAAHMIIERSATLRISPKGSFVPCLLEVLP